MRKLTEVEIQESMTKYMGFAGFEENDETYNKLEKSLRTLEIKSNIMKFCSFLTYGKEGNLIIVLC